MPGELFPLDSVALLVAVAGAAVLALAALAALAAIPAAGVVWTWRVWRGRVGRTGSRGAGSSVPLDTAASATPGCVRHAGGQFLGAREVQEDDHGFIDGPTLDPVGQHPVAVVADGMGGHASGEVASRVAVRAFVETYAIEGRVADRLRASLDCANAAIADAIRRDPSLDGMGTTLVAAALTADGLEWVSVGDSPLYLYRTGRLKRLNADHSMAPVIAAMRDMDPEVAAGMSSHDLRSALVGQDIAKIDASTMPELLRPGDLVLLASDGLDTLGDDEAAVIIDANCGDGPEAVKDALLDAVAARGDPAQDNVSVALIEAPCAAPDAAGRARDTEQLRDTASAGDTASVGSAR